MSLPDRMPLDQRLATFHKILSADFAIINDLLKKVDKKIDTLDLSILDPKSNDDTFQKQGAAIITAAATLLRQLDTILEKHKSKLEKQGLNKMRYDEIIHLRDDVVIQRSEVAHPGIKRSIEEIKELLKIELNKSPFKSTDLMAADDIPKFEAMVARLQKINAYDVLKATRTSLDNLHNALLAFEPKDQKLIALTKQKLTHISNVLDNAKTIEQENRHAVSTANLGLMGKRARIPSDEAGRPARPARTEATVKKSK